MRRTTPSERFDAGIEPSEFMIESILTRAGIPSDARDGATLKRARRILREETLKEIIRETREHQAREG